MSTEKLKEVLNDNPAPVAKVGPSLAQILKDVGGKIWDGAAPMVDHGSSELAAALLGNGSAHVPYGWSNTSEGEENAAPKTPEPEAPERGGMER